MEKSYSKIRMKNFTGYMRGCQNRFGISAIEVGYITLLMPFAWFNKYQTP